MKNIQKKKKFIIFIKQTLIKQKDKLYKSYLKSEESTSKKDIITLKSNKSGTVYHAKWIKPSPIMDKKKKFQLEKFVYKTMNKKSKNKKVDIFGIEIYLLAILTFMVGVILTTFTECIPLELSPYLDGSFLFMLLIFTLIKDFLYEKIHINIKNERIIGVHILLFKFGNFTTIFSFFLFSTESIRIKTN